MRTMSDHIYDITNNSIKAESKNILLDLKIKENRFVFRVEDDGKGIPPEMLENIFDPFVTGRDKRIRKVGLGLPLIKQNAELTGGSVTINSEVGVGTKLEVIFNIDNIDIVPIGDIPGTIVGLMTAKDGIEWDIRFSKDDQEDSITTTEIRDALGDEIPINSLKVIPVLKDLIEGMISEIEFNY